MDGDIVLATKSQDQRSGISAQNEDERNTGKASKDASSDITAVDLLLVEIRSSEKQRGSNGT